MPQVFLVLMVIGLVGLFVMAMPAFSHGHAISTGAHGLMHGVHTTHVHHGLGHDPTVHGSREVLPADTSPTGVVRLVPSPRAIFSVLALYGAFGNLLVAAHVPFVAALFLAALPSFLIERLALRPLWDLVLRFQGAPSAPLATLVMTEATAITPFRNGRGVVSVLKDGRLIQMSARLRDEERTLPVGVGERLRVEDVDVRRERLTVSVVHGQEVAP
jgi:hypothetical protein